MAPSDASVILLSDFFWWHITREREKKTEISCTAIEATIKVAAYRPEMRVCS